MGRTEEFVNTLFDAGVCTSKHKYNLCQKCGGGGLSAFAHAFNNTERTGGEIICQEKVRK